MKIAIILLFMHLSNADNLIEIVGCTDGCRTGPIKLPYYFCQCPITVNPELSTCIRKCANDVLCRLCPGNAYLGLPTLCPLTIKRDIDLSGTTFDFIFKNVTKISGLDKAVATDLLYFDPVTRFTRANLLVDKLTIEGKYIISGKFCGDTVSNSEGNLKITFENVTLDWYLSVEIILKCNITYFRINGPKSNLILSTNKKVKFEFQEQNVTDSTISQCANDNSEKILEKIINPLQNLFNNAFTDFINVIILQVPIYYIFKIGSVTPITSVVIPQGLIPGDVVPGGDITGSLPVITNSQLESLANIGLAPSDILLNNIQTAGLNSGGSIPNILFP